MSPSTSWLTWEVKLPSKSWNRDGETSIIPSNEATARLWQNGWLRGWRGDTLKWSIHHNGVPINQIVIVPGWTPTGCQFHSVKEPFLLWHPKWLQFNALCIVDKSNDEMLYFLICIQQSQAPKYTKAQVCSSKWGLSDTEWRVVGTAQCALLANIWKN